MKVETTGLERAMGVGVGLAACECGACLGPTLALVVHRRDGTSIEALVEYEYIEAFVDEVQRCATVLMLTRRLAAAGRPDVALAVLEAFAEDDEDDEAGKEEGSCSTNR